MKKISKPRHKNLGISIHTLETSHFRPLHKNQAVSNLCTENKSIPIPRTEIKSISPIYTKLSQLISALKTNNSRPAHKNQVTFDPHAQHQVNFDQYTKTQ